MKKLVIGMAIGLICCTTLFAQESKPDTIKLPQPQMSGGKPLMEALKDRQTGRDFSDKPLDVQTISDLLWAAYGINRPESGKRTAPSAMNWQEVTIYVSMKDGVYTYDAVNNCLLGVMNGDQRSKMGKQSFLKDAPVVLTFVADQSKYISVMDKADKDFYSGINTGFISQNVYLYCSSTGLSTVVLGYIDRGGIAKTLNLDKQCKVVVSQCVGYPAE
jgi:SagB-type dehydrogenase family enzyme